MTTKVWFKNKVWTISSLILILITAAAWKVISIARFPKPGGEYAVGAYSLELIDSSRISESRRLLVQFYYPAGPHSGKQTAYTPNPDEMEAQLNQLYGVPKLLLRKITRSGIPATDGAPAAAGRQLFPLLIFSHGYNGSRFQNSFMLPELASNGYIIASIEHTGASSGAVFSDGSQGAVTPFDSLQIDNAFSIAEIEKWSADQQFVLSRINLLSAAGTLPFSHVIDTTHVGVFGHSFGGATSAETLVRDPRFMAGINLDGFYFGNNYPKGFTQPFMEIRADNKPAAEMSDKALKEWNMTREKYQRMLFDEWNKRIQSYARNGYTSYSIRHANHMSFSDFSLLMPFAMITAPHRDEHHRVVNHLVLNFFNRHLKNTATAPIPEKLEYYIKK